MIAASVSFLILFLRGNHCYCLSVYHSKYLPLYCKYVIFSVYVGTYVLFCDILLIQH